MEDSKVTRDLVIFLPNHTKVYQYHRLIVVRRRFCDAGYVGSIGEIHEKKSLSRWLQLQS